MFLDRVLGHGRLPSSTQSGQKATMRPGTDRPWHSGTLPKNSLEAVHVRCVFFWTYKYDYSINLFFKKLLSMAEHRPVVVAECPTRQTSWKPRSHRGQKKMLSQKSQVFVRRAARGHLSFCSFCIAGQVLR